MRSGRVGPATLSVQVVNLAEVLAQIVTAGRQVIVAVEDAALADLLCRRMPVMAPATAARLTLGLDAERMSALIDKREPAPLEKNGALNGGS